MGSFDSLALFEKDYGMSLCRDGWILTTVMMPGKRLSVALVPVEQFSR